MEPLGVFLFKRPIARIASGSFSNFFCIVGLLGSRLFVEGDQ